MTDRPMLESRMQRKLPVRFGGGWAETSDRKTVWRRPSTLCHELPCPRRRCHQSAAQARAFRPSHDRQVCSHRVRPSRDHPGARGANGQAGCEADEGTASKVGTTGSLRQHPIATPGRAPESVSRRCSWLAAMGGRHLAGEAVGNCTYKGTKSACADSG
jgi:hypothetical protein